MAANRAMQLYCGTTEGVVRVDGASGAVTRLAHLRGADPGLWLADAPAAAARDRAGHRPLG